MRVESGGQAAPSVPHSEDATSPRTSGAPANQGTSASGPLPDDPAVTPSSIGTGGPDAADAFLKRLEQIDVGSLAIGDLLKDLEQESSPDTVDPRAIITPASALNASHAPTRPSPPPTPQQHRVVNGAATSPAAAPPARTDARRHDTPSPEIPRESVASALTTSESPDAPSTQADGAASSFPWVGVGVAAVVVVGLAAFALRSVSPRNADGTAGAPAAHSTSPSSAGAAATAPASDAAAAPGTTAAATPGAAVNVDAQLKSLTDRTRQQLAAGQHTEALDTLGSALSLRADAGELKALVAQAASDTRRGYEAARRAARAVNATGTPKYREAEGLVRTAARRRGTPDLDTAKAYLAATTAMNASADDARAKAAERAAAQVASGSPATSGTAPLAATQAPVNPTSAPPAPTSPAAQTAAARAGTGAPTGTAAASIAPTSATQTNAGTSPAATPAPASTAPLRQEPTQQARANAATPQIAELAVPRPPVTAPASGTGTGPTSTPAPPTTPTPREAEPAARPSAAIARSAAADEQSIRSVLQAYAAAHSRLDAQGVGAVYPSTDVAALRRSFSGMRSQRVQILNEQIQITGSTAIVNCVWQTVFELNAGAPNRSAPQTTLTLQRSGDTWVIVGRR